MRIARGFTLLEVLVALAIFATVAAAAYATILRSLRNAAGLETRVLASWIADNRITEMQLAGGVASPGRNQTQVDFGGRNWDVLTETTATSEPAMYRVDVWVAPDGGDVVVESVDARAAVQLVGFLGSGR